MFFQIFGVSISTLQFSLIIPLLILFTLVIFTNYRQTNLPPGPFAWPIIGNLLTFSKKEALGIQLAKWRKIYGDPYTIYLGSTPVVIVNSWPVIQEATILKSNHFTDRFPLKTGEVLSQGGNGISFHNGAIWNLMRKVGNAVVRKYSLSENLPLNVQWAVNQSLADFPEDGHSVDPTATLACIMLNIAFSNIVGRTENSLQDPIFQELRKGSLAVRDFFSDSLWYDHVPLYRNLIRNHKREFEQVGYFKLLSTMKDILNQHRASYLETETKNFTDALISVQVEAKQDDPELAKHLDDDAICQIMFELLQASSDTSALGLIYMVRILSLFPEVQKRIREENLRELGSDRLPNQSDRSQCHYTMAVIHEVFRIAMPTTSGFMRGATVNTELGGFKIKRGTAVLLNYVGVTSDGTCWPEPDVFRPERFLENESGVFQSTLPPGFLPFGIGRRNCFGQKIAALHLFVAVVLLLRRFEFEAETAVVESATEGKITLETEPFFVVAIPKPFQIKVRRL